MGAEEANTRLREVRFKYRHDGCWLQETTERHPRIQMVASSIYLHGKNVHMNLTVHSPRSDTIGKIHEEWQADERIKKVVKLGTSPHGTRFHARYFSENSIYHLILEHSPVGFGAVRFADGVEYYQMIGESKDVQELISILSERGDLQVRSIRDPGDSVPDADELGEAERPRPWATLTDKQLAAVVLAQEGGYYRWPREMSASALAATQGLSSSAFLDHLRHAEAKLVSAIVDDLRHREPGRVQSILGTQKRA